MLKRMCLQREGDQIKSWSPLQLFKFTPATIFLSTLLVSLGHAQEFSRIDKTVFARGATAADSLKDGRRAQSGPDWDEGPQHNVQVSSFQIANRQVSMQQFANFMAGYRQRIESYRIEWSADSPAVLVSWNEATAYCQWLSKQTQQTYRLPTEAEWELAAANADELKLSAISDGVREWCHDWWRPYTFTEKPLIDPRGPNFGTVRVFRDGGGGSVEETKRENKNENVTGSPVADYRVTDRSATVPDDRRPNLGFRLVVGKAFDGETAEQGRLSGIPLRKRIATKEGLAQRPDDSVFCRRRQVHRSCQRTVCRTSVLESAPRSQHHLLRQRRSVGNCVHGTLRQQRPNGNPYHSITQRSS